MTGRGISITIPMAPPRELLPNNRRKLHWTIQADASSTLRMAAKAAAINAQTTRFETPVIVSYEVVWPHWMVKDKRPIPDHDAIPTACKPILDGIVDAGIIVGDEDRYVAEIRARGRRGAKDEDGATVVTITELA